MGCTLDEVQHEQRNACVEALNKFIQTHGVTELTICCRIRDYQALSEWLTLRRTISIQPLTPEQIHSYCAQAGEQLSGLTSALKKDRELQVLATSPLMLSIMSWAYKDCTTEEVKLGSGGQDSQKRLFEAYINRMFQRRGKTQQYPRQKTQRWLKWLAQYMIVADQTIFSIEQIQPSWFPKKKDRIFYRMSSSVIGGSIVTVMVFCTSFLFFVLAELEYSRTLENVKDAIFVGIIYGAIYGTAIIFFEEIKFIKTIAWSTEAIRKQFNNGLLGSLTCMLIIFLINDIFIGSYVFSIPTLLYFLSHILIVGLVGNETTQESKQIEEPNKAIKMSILMPIYLGMIGTIIVFLVTVFIDLMTAFDLKITSSSISHALGSGLVGVALSATPVFLIFGWSACIRYFILRVFLFQKKHSPWNYCQFLDFATDRLLLQKVGSSYIFVHRLLREHFADMSLEQKQR